MLESGSSGSVRGVLSNEHPYREPGPKADVGSVARCSGLIVTARFFCLAKWTSPFHRRRPNWAFPPEGLVH